METTDLRREIQPAADQAELFLSAAARPITTAGEYNAGADFLKTIKGAAKELDDREKAIIRPINDSLRSIRDLFRKPKDTLARAECALKGAMLGYQREQQRIAGEAQRKAEEAARKERERLERLAKAARKRDDVAKVEQFEQRAATVVAPIIQAEKPKVAGIATRKRYTFKITDVAQLPREYLQPDTVKIGKVVRALGAETSIPGIRIIEEETIASRAFA